MKILKTPIGYSFENLNILGPNQDDYLIYQHDTLDLIALMAKSFSSTEFIVDFGMFWYLVDETSITCIRLHEHPKFVSNIKALNLETKHCIEVFANCGHINKVRYNRDLYGRALKSYRSFKTYTLINV